MCGILAVIGQYPEDKIRERAARMQHRGPDERETLVTSVGVLSHERLSIIDVTSGRQPIQGTNNTWVIHNGEIYNHKQLYQQYFAGSRTLRTHSDSEIIVHLYEAFVYDFCNKLDGMFAFVVLDEDNKRFMAARDPLGIKPLYYGTDAEGRMWFASEMKAIADAVESVHIFPPGHYYTAETGFVKYYHPMWETEPADDSSATGLRELLEAAVEKRLMTDVPFGVLLSGGLDSSLIASIVSRKCKARQQPLHSFTIGLTSDAPDMKAAKEVAAFIDTIHHEVTFTVEEGIAIAKQLIWHLESYDMTTLRASVPMYFLTRYIRQQGIKMVLSGEGADEVFGGYLYFYNAPDAHAFQEETKRRVRLLHTADLLRADKSTMANGIEVRVPMLDKNFLEKAIRLSPKLKMPIRKTQDSVGQIEKYVLRSAFDDSAEPYLPAHILWRQKEQFSDGVGYGWIDGFQAFCNQTVSDAEFAQREALFPYQTPQTKEAFYIRTIFEEYFPQVSAAKTVSPWIPKWQTNADPSGRANAVHLATTEVEKEAEKTTM